MASLIPYGVSDFSVLREDGSLFVDHTRFIRAQEDSARVLLFLRPRRFGKSLWLSILEHYYDMRHAPRFEALFGGLDIGREPTQDRGRYLVLRLDFSGIHPQGSPEQVSTLFMHSLRRQALHFIQQHEPFLVDPPAARQILNESISPGDLFASLADIVQGSGHPLYLLVDEYDNFTNELAATGQESTYAALVQGAGIVRSFFKTVKEATGTGRLSRCLLTGVNPILLNDLTSGFNISLDVSQSPRFAELLGFTRGEVEVLLDRTAPQGVDRVATLNLMEDWYDGYRFHPKSERLFNPDMVLYFLSRLQDGAPPAEPLDRNIRTDLHKLGLVARNPARDELLQELCARGRIVSHPSDALDIQGLTDPQKLPSILYWMGMLSLGKEPGTLGIPNYAVARQYWEETLKLVGRDAGVVSVGPIRDTLHLLMREGIGEPFFRLALELVMSRLSNRDFLKWGEASVKAILLSFLSLTPDVAVFSEWESQRGYADLVIIPSPQAEWYRHAWMIELKYLKKGEDSPESRARALTEGQAQLARYLSDPARTAYLARFELHAAVALYVDAQELVWLEVPSAPQSSFTG